MKKLSKNQKGFTTLEMLLVIVILAIIGFTGYTVWHDKQQTDKTLNNASNVSQVVPKVSSIKTFADCQNTAGSITQQSYPEVCVTKSGQKFTQPTSSSSQQYFTISQWGVRALYSGSLDLEYAIDPAQSTSSASNPEYASFSSSQLDSSGPHCKVNLSQGGGYGGVINRYKSTDDVLVGDFGSDSGKTAAQYAATLPLSDYGHVGDYYYFWQSPQALCGASQSSQDLQDQTTQAVQNITSSLQAIPQ